MKPTDDELEAMASGVLAQTSWGVPLDTEFAQKTAAMLRACKGRVKRLPRGDGEGGWTLDMALLAEIRDEVYANEWDAPCAEVIEIIALSVERRILAALEPAPDHAEWDAVCVAWRLGVEAAVATIHENRVEWLTTPYDEWARSRSRTAEELIDMALATATPSQEELFSKIRTIKKGPPQ